MKYPLLALGFSGLLLGGCATGDARITRGYRLKAKHVIHCVGPVWHGGKHNEAELLASCYRESLLVADHLGADSIAFPAVSAGVYAWPAESAARIAIATVNDSDTAIAEIRFVLLDPEVLAAFQRVAAEE
jgi:O-acetyl-ADP-ribose deacetylase (regulator of RNase III)